MGDLSETHLDNLLSGYSGTAGTDVLAKMVSEIRRHRAIVGSGARFDALILVVPDQVGALVAKAQIGEISWETVAMHEKAYLGFVTYATYARMTTAERNRVGAMNQTTVRAKLRIR